jgi:hypothetical protein
MKTLKDLMDKKAEYDHFKKSISGSDDYKVALDAIREIKDCLGDSLTMFNDYLKQYSNNCDDRDGFTEAELLKFREKYYRSEPPQNIQLDNVITKIKHLSSLLTPREYLETNLFNCTSRQLRQSILNEFNDTELELPAVYLSRAIFLYKEIIKNDKESTHIFPLNKCEDKELDRALISYTTHREFFLSSFFRDKSHWTTIRASSFQSLLHEIEDELERRSSNTNPVSVDCEEEGKPIDRADYDKLDAILKTNHIEMKHRDTDEKWTIPFPIENSEFSERKLTKINSFIDQIFLNRIYEIPKDGKEFEKDYTDKKIVTEANRHFKKYCPPLITRQAPFTVDQAVHPHIKTRFRIKKAKSSNKQSSKPNTLSTSSNFYYERKEDATQFPIDEVIKNLDEGK